MYNRFLRVSFIFLGKGAKRLFGVSCSKFGKKAKRL